MVLRSFDSTGNAEVSDLINRLLEVVQGAVVIIDIQKKKVTYISDRATDYLEESIEDLLKADYRNWIKKLFPEEISVVLEIIEKIPTIDDSETLNLEYRIQKKSGNYIWISQNIRVFSRDKKKEIEKVICFAQDITKQKKNEEQLRKREAHVLALVDAIPGYVSWIKNDLTYVGVNQNLARTMKLEAKDFVGKPLGFMGGKSESELKIMVQEFVNSSANFFQKEILVENKIKGTSNFIMSLAKFGAEEDVVMIGIDITGQKSLEKEVEGQRSKAVYQSRMAALGEMASGIAHEVNNPLTIILGASSDILNRLETNRADPVILKKNAALLIKSTDRIAKIIKGLRSFARDGEKDPMQLVSAKSVIQDTLEFCHARAKNNSIEIRLAEISEEIKIFCRPVQISQVVLNLLNNAFDAITGSENAWVSIGLTATDTNIEIAITDCGNGIPPDILEKIMQPFFTTKEVGKGTGLGLSISEGIMKDHNGTLAYNKESKNTQFIVRLPKPSTNHGKTA